MNSTNGTTTSEACVFPMAYKVTVSTLLAITFLISPVLNTVVCYTIFSVKRLQTFGNLLIANLSLGDIIISLTLPLMEIIYVSIYPKWLTGKIGTYFLNCVWLFSLASPFVIVTVITAERYKTLKSLIPIKSKTVIFIVIPLVWLYSFGSVAFMAFFFTVPGEDAYEWNILPQFYYPFLGVHIVIPLVVISALYLAIYRMTRSSRKQTIRHGKASSNLAKREMRVAKTIGIVIGLMFAIWIPALVLEYFYAIGTESCIVQMAGPVSVWLSSSNGMVNPILYFFRNPSLRGEIIKKLPTSISNFWVEEKKTQERNAKVRARCNVAFKNEKQDMAINDVSNCTYGTKSTAANGETTSTNFSQESFQENTRL